MQFGVYQMVLSKNENKNHNIKIVFFIYPVYIHVCTILSTLHNVSEKKIILYTNLFQPQN